MEFLWVILLSTTLFCCIVTDDRQVFHLQPFDAANKTSGAYPPVGVERSGKMRTRRRFSNKSNVPEISLEGKVGKRQSSQTDDVVFDAGEDVRVLEYDDDYRALKKEYATTVERTQQMISNGAGEHESDDDDTGCWWIFCSLSRKSTFVVIFAVVLTLFWFYSGILCYYLPCGWASRARRRTQIRDLLESSKPGQVFDAQAGRVLNYAPCDEELKKFREILEAFQDL